LVPSSLDGRSERLASLSLSFRLTHSCGDGEAMTVMRELDKGELPLSVIESSPACVRACVR
jgi:hypothetical protein